MPHDGEDHAPTVARIALPPEAAECLVKRRVAEYDRNGWRDLGKAAVFCHLITQIVSPPCNMEPSSHDFILNESVKGAAVEAFGPQSRNRSRPTFALPQ